MNIRPLLPALLALVLFGACRKESGPGGILPPNTNSTLAGLRDLLESNVAAATQSFTVSNAGGQVVGANGTTISYQAGAFLLGNGTAATGAITLQLVEALTLGDLVKMNLQTVGNDNGTLRLLTTGGAFRLTASQNGQPLRPVPGSIQVTVPFQVAPDPAMALFLGARQELGDMVWDPTIGDVTADSLGYSFMNDSLSWVNCDYFYTLPGPYTGVSFNLPSGHVPINTRLFAVLPVQRTVFSVPVHLNEFGIVSGGGNYGLPIGTNIKVAGLHLAADSSLHSSFANFTLSANMEVDLSFSPTTLAAFNAVVSAW